MARYTGPSCKLCRREKTKLFLKGDRCLNGKCSLEKRPTAPGQHGAANVKVKEYGKQLREKQKAKRYYGLQEGQFKSYFKEADRVEGVTGENLLILLERRFDNVVYRMGMAESRKEARQLVLHGHFRVNGKKATIPSMLLKKGDVITVREESRSSAKIKELVEGLDSRIAPKWLLVDKEALKATIDTLPVREDIDFPFEEQLIVELYSK
jgi:small subunit ribosomal protein S4